MNYAEQFRVAAAIIERGDAELCWGAMQAAQIPSAYRGDFGMIFGPSGLFVDKDCRPYYAWRATALCFAAAMIETGDFE